MPYLNVSDPDNFIHLLQLFYAAHPHYQQEHEKVRAHTGLPGEYFLSMPVARELAVWAREQHLLTRKDAHRLLEVAWRLEADDDPGTTVAVTPRVLGTPPKLQPTVLGTDIYRWLYLCETTQVTEEYVYTLDAAMTLLRHVMADAAESDVIRERAHRLADWLTQRRDAAPLRA